MSRTSVPSRSAVFYVAVGASSFVIRFRDQKITAPHTRAGMRGGCSPQNNLRKLRRY
jgi:hypothetical protein